MLVLIDPDGIHMTQYYCCAETEISRNPASSSTVVVFLPKVSSELFQHASLAIPENSFLLLCSVSLDLILYDIIHFQASETLDSADHNNDTNTWAREWVIGTVLSISTSW